MCEIDDAKIGAMPYMTPLRETTESSTMPKSVMKTTVGGGCCARRGLGGYKITRSARTELTVDGRLRMIFVLGLMFRALESSFSERTSVY